jgi:hypothetical protein
LQERHGRGIKGVFRRPVEIRVCKKNLEKE